MLQVSLKTDFLDLYLVFFYKITSPVTSHRWEYLVNKPLQAAGMSADNVRG